MRRQIASRSIHVFLDDVHFETLYNQVPMATISAKGMGMRPVWPCVLPEVCPPHISEVCVASDISD